MSTIEKAFSTRKQPPATDENYRSEKSHPTHGIERPGNSPGAMFEPAIPFVPAQPVELEEEKAVVNIPFERLHAEGYLTPANPRGTTAEEFRTIKRPLLKNIAGQSAARIKNANLIMVTSALEGDGKTFSSLNLAMSIAMEQDKTVLFIDGDVLKASAGRALNIPQGTPGLIEILMGNVEEPEDVILRTSMDKLRIMPAGAPHENATELLAGKTMYGLMMELSSRNADRVIVVDSPPLLLTTESSVLASFMGQIVFVAAANITPQHAVREALEQIGKDKMVAVMLNKAPRQRFNIFGIGHSYGYGYGYGYGFGYRQDAYSETTGTPGR